MGLPSLKKEPREFIKKLAKELNFTYDGVTGGGHLRLKHPNGATLYIAGTTSDRRARRYELATARRLVYSPGPSPQPDSTRTR